MKVKAVSERYPEMELTLGTDPGGRTTNLGKVVPIPFLVQYLVRSR